MAEGGITGKGFKPGQSGNPKGKPKSPVNFKAVREFNKQEFDSLMNQYLFSPDSDVYNIAISNEVLVIEKMCANFVLKSYADHNYLKLLLERFLGKVPDVIKDERSPHAILMALLDSTKPENDNGES